MNGHDRLLVIYDMYTVPFCRGLFFALKHKRQAMTIFKKATATSTLASCLVLKFGVRSRLKHTQTNEKGIKMDAQRISININVDKTRPSISSHVFSYFLLSKVDQAKQKRAVSGVHPMAPLRVSW